MARPRKHHKPKDFAAQAKAYINGGYEEAGDAVPTVEGLACTIGTTRHTIYQWEREGDSEVSITLEALKSVQARALVSKGLTGDFNPTITKMLLNVNHDMVERSAKEISGPNGGPVAVQEVRRTIVDPGHTDS